MSTCSVARASPHKPISTGKRRPIRDGSIQHERQIEIFNREVFFELAVVGQRFAVFLNVAEVIRAGKSDKY